MANPSFLKENKAVKIRLAAILCLCFIYGFNFAAVTRFPCNTIPSELLENANVVVRLLETRFDIQSPGKAVMKVNYAVTVLNDDAIEHSFLNLGYDKFSTIRNVTGTVYDKNGEKVERIEKSQILDLSNISGYSTYEDSRQILVKPRYQTVPFTIEYTYEITYNGILGYPGFYPVTDFNMAVEEANLVVTTYNSNSLRYFHRNTAVNCTRDNQMFGEIFSWSFSKIHAFRKEPFSLPLAAMVPSVLLAPRFFELKGRSGNMDSWQYFGTWMYELLRDRDDLSEETKQKITTLVAADTDPEKKIEKLYKYLQDKTRYVSIQIGIGGWQPAPASEVDRLGYGDCKALTNYMKSLLSVAGITSYYTLVSAGREEPDIIEEFPSNQFNHAILCVPLKSDTLWLECTIQDLPLGYQSTFTDNRFVLLVRSDGGFLCRTPVYDQKVNVRNRLCNVELQRNGQAKMKVTTRNYGLYFDKSSDLLDMDDLDKKTELTEKVSAPIFVLNSFSVKEHKEKLPLIEEELNLTIEKIFTNAGDFLLLPPNQLSRHDVWPSQTINRTNAISIQRSTIQTDTVFYYLPGDLTFNGNQVSKVVSSKYGVYSAVTTLEGQTIRYVRQLLVYKGVYDKEDYEDLLTFFDKVSDADALKISLRVAN